ncbi:16S rRNA (uracil(1498)-N(3))-methyltransferase [Parapedobacter sp.]
MHLFYTPDIQPQHTAFILNEEESKHAVRVLRLSAGQQVQLIDGRGGRYTAVMADAHPKRAVLEIVAVRASEGNHPYHLHIAIAPTKNMDRMEWFLEKATEVGVDEITPIICDHSERTTVKAERLHKVAVAAMKQSQRAYLPQVNPAIDFAAFVERELPGKRFIAHCADGDKKYFSQLLKPGESATVLIGPEGDFSTAEIDAAIRRGFIPTTFGPMRLRTETAALVACVEAHLLHIDFVGN